MLVRRGRSSWFQLGISERTVKAHLTSIFATIGVVTDRTQAAL
ncbi:MAG: LuxR C-terminal-related transcriptional regulator [Ilumatobacteraceae bacterium]